MPRYTLDLPTGGSIEYGLDLSVEPEWFAESLDEGGRVIDLYVTTDGIESQFHRDQRGPVPV